MSTKFPRLTKEGWVVEPPAKVAPPQESWKETVARARGRFPNLPTVVAVGLDDRGEDISSYAGLTFDEIAARLMRFPNVGKANASKAAAVIVASPKHVDGN